MVLNLSSLICFSISCVALDALVNEFQAFYLIRFSTKLLVTQLFVLMESTCMLRFLKAKKGIYHD